MDASDGRIGLWSITCFDQHSECCLWSDPKWFGLSSSCEHEVQDTEGSVGCAMSIYALAQQALERTLTPRKPETALCPQLPLTTNWS